MFGVVSPCWLGAYGTDILGSNASIPTANPHWLCLFGWMKQRVERIWTMFGSFHSFLGYEPRSLGLNCRSILVTIAERDYRAYAEAISGVCDLLLNDLTDLNPEERPVTTCHRLSNAVAHRTVSLRIGFEDDVKPSFLPLTFVSGTVSIETPT